MAGPADDPEDNEKDKKPIIPLGAHARRSTAPKQP
jgi:hypothetical protein